MTSRNLSMKLLDPTQRGSTNRRWRHEPWRVLVRVGSTSLHTIGGRLATEADAEGLADGVRRLLKWKVVDEFIAVPEGQLDADPTPRGVPQFERVTVEQFLLEQFARFEVFCHRVPDGIVVDWSMLDLIREVIEAQSELKQTMLNASDTIRE